MSEDVTDAAVAPSVDAGGVRRRFLIAAGAGAFAALLLFAVVLQSGRDGWFQEDLFGGFYDAQGRALLEGRMDVDPDVPGIEGFRIDDRTYIYQGIVPALARVPLLAVTDRLDGRTTGLSMLLGAALALAYVVAAAWVARRTLRPGAPLGRGETALTGVAVFGAGTGSLLFLAGQVWVYHEALVWGAALALGSLTHLVVWLLDRSSIAVVRGGRFQTHDRHLLVAIVLAGLALNTRSSVGVGPMAALAAVAALLAIDVARPRGTSTGRSIAMLRGVAAWWSGSRSQSWGPLAAVVLGASLSVVLHVAVNVARFGSLIGVPLERQVLVDSDPRRLDALAANDGSLFGLHYAPSVLMQILRPDALGVRSHFPFVGFPAQRPAVVGDALFAELDWSASVPSSHPLLFLAALVGVAVLVTGRSAARSWRIPVLGGALGVAPIVVFGYIAHRYLVDLVPLLVLAGALGLQAVAGRSSRWRGWVRRGAAGFVVLTALFGAWVNASLALQYQREVAPQRSESERAGWLALQQRLGGRFEVITIELNEPAPPAGPVGQLLVVADCEALLRSSGSGWYLVENSEGAGGVRLDLTAAAPIDLPVAIMRSRADDVGAELVVEPAEVHSSSSVRLVVEIDRAGERVRSFVGPSFELAAGAVTSLEVQMDHRAGETVVRDPASGEELLRVQVPLPGEEPEPVTDAGLDVAVSPLPTPRCDALDR